MSGCASLVSERGPQVRDAAEPKRPNIVLIVADDQGWTDFGFMGHPVVETPNLDRLAAESALFENGYVPTSLCRASLATLLTGLYAHQHHICCNDPPAGVAREAMLPFLAQAPTLPRLLAGAGYVSFQSGKFWEGHFSNGGFTEGMTLNRLGGRHGDRGLAIGRRTLDPVFEFLERSKEQPFFLWYAPLMPHLPHDPPGWILERYQAEELGLSPGVASYYAMITWFDRTVGQLLGQLERLGLRESTLVVFVVDNGWLQGPEPGARPRSKLSPYDAGVRTPILLHWPGQIPSGRHRDLVSTIDLAPTLLTAADLPLTGAMQGLSLFPTAQGQGPLGRETVFGEIYVHRARSLEHTEANLTHRWLRSGPNKLIVPALEGMEPELYDLEHDPGETLNLAPTQPEHVRALRLLLEEWWAGR